MSSPSSPHSFPLPDESRGWGIHPLEAGDGLRACIPGPGGRGPLQPSREYVAHRARTPRPASGLPFRPWPFLLLPKGWGGAASRLHPALPARSILRGRRRPRPALDPRLAAASRDAPLPPPLLAAWARRQGDATRQALHAAEPAKQVDGCLPLDRMKTDGQMEMNSFSLRRCGRWRLPWRVLDSRGKVIRDPKSRSSSAASAPVARPRPAGEEGRVWGTWKVQPPLQGSRMQPTRCMTPGFTWWKAPACQVTENEGFFVPARVHAPGGPPF